MRVSTDEQANEGFSITAQQDRIQSYAQLRNLDLLDVVIDAGVSGAKPLSSRDGGARLLNLVNARMAGGIVAWKLDRVFRNASDCLAMTSLWDKRNVNLHLIDLGGQPVDTSSAMGRFFLTVMAGVAELERNQISERTRMTLASKRSRNEYVGVVPYGFSLDEKNSRLIPNPNECRALRRMKQLRKRGFSLRKVVAKLNDEGVPARGERWYLGTVARLLQGIS